MSDTPAIQVGDLHKSYRMGDEQLHVLRGVSLSIAPGEFVAIVGASGSGKSTLLHMIGLLDRPDKGTVNLAGTETTRLPAGRRNRLRCRHVGFVFQFYHLLPELSVLQNTLLPAKVDLSVAGWFARRSSRRAQAAELLGELGLSGRLRHKPGQLSGGERQRVAIARALINGPEVLLADEPTGNLDSTTGGHIMEILERWNQQRNQTLLMVTHDVALARQAHRTLRLTDGRLGRD